MMLNLLVTVIILGLIFWLLYWLISQLPLPPPFAVVARVILALACVLVLLSLLPGLHFGNLSASLCR